MERTIYRNIMHHLEDNDILFANLVPRAFPLKMGGAGKGPGIGWSRVSSYTLKSRV